MFDDHARGIRQDDWEKRGGDEPDDGDQHEQLLNAEMRNELWFRLSECRNFSSNRHRLILERRYGPGNS